jgi:hypothetical protein
MPCTGIIGDVRQGKTLLMVKLLAEYMDDNPGGEVMANFHLDKKYFPDARYIEPADLLKVDRSRGTIVALDEAYAWLESRTNDGGNGIKEFMSYRLFQGGKDNIEWVLTAQLFSTIDLRFRGLTSKLIEARKQESRERFQYIYWSPDMSYVKGVRYLRYEAASKYYPMYDTLEKIDPIDQDMMFKVILDKTKLNPELDAIIAQLYEISPKWTRTALSGFLREHKYAESYGKYVWERMKYLEVVRGNLVDEKAEI